MTTTATQTDRFHRAPRGGAISPVNGQFYKGGQFMPLVAAVVEFRPAPLAGSSRQVLWATRLRREELARLEEEVSARRLSLASPAEREWAPGNRRAIRRFLTAHYRLMVERSAGAIIDRRMAAMA